MDHFLGSRSLPVKHRVDIVTERKYKHNICHQVSLVIRTCILCMHSCKRSNLQGQHTSKLHECAHACVHAYARMYVCVCLCVCVCACMHVCVCTRVFASVPVWDVYMSG